MTLAHSGNAASIRFSRYSVVAALLDRDTQSSPLSSADAEPIDRGSVKSVTATGVDVALRIWMNILAADLLTTRAYLSAMSYAVPQIRPENKRALALLDEWMSEPDDLGGDWWAEFEKDLREHRLAFRHE